MILDTFSGRKGVLGEKGCDDIFAFEKLVSMLEVQVIDKETKEPVLGSVGCLKSEYNESLKSDLPTDDNAKFKLELAPKTYIACASAEGYEPGQTKVVLKKGKFQTVLVELQKIKIEKPVVVKEFKCPEITLEDIYYDFDKYNIRSDASASLDELAIFLMENSEIRIKLISHTDCRGTNAYNDRLSNNRAKSAKEYLIRKGVQSERIIEAYGVGEREPVNNCADGVKCSERQHQANRRTVVELVTDDCFEVKRVPNPYLYDSEFEQQSSSDY